MSVETQQWLGEILGALFVAFAAFSLLALGTYHPTDALFEWIPVGNRAGVAGASIAGLLVHGFGVVGASVVVGAVALLGLRLLMGRGLPLMTYPYWVGAGLLLLAVVATPALLGSIGSEMMHQSEMGSISAWLAGLELDLFGDWGSLIINLLLFSLGGLILLEIPFATAASTLKEGSMSASALVTKGAFIGGGALVEGTKRCAALLAATPAAIQVWVEQRARRRRVSALRDGDPEIVQFADGDGKNADAKKGKRANGKSADKAKRGEPAIIDHLAEQRANKKPEQEVFSFDEGGPDGPFALPDASLFDASPKAGEESYDRESLLMNSRILEKKLLDFNVAGRVVAVHPGPVITMYEFEPAPGVKVGSIVRLSSDLSLALRALSIRIVAPIPGKAVVGIEIPNKERDNVSFRELIESNAFRNTKSSIPLAMGKDIFGTPVEADLQKMPHLLVAGATGTGKSVFLNSLIVSVLMRARPCDVKLLLIDPKMLELSVYQGIPHLIADVVTDPKRAAAALFGLVQKMEERYVMMSALGVRNISQYNERVSEALDAGERTFRLKNDKGKAEGVEVEYVRLPYIVVIIDELADLMMVSAKTVEDSLQRLAQMARASGIHLVLATQRPSVDVLTGVIKANFPSRISFQVSSRIDSRTILDSNGAEDLLGAGDMLYLPPGTAKLIRLHGPYIGEKEVVRLVQFLTDQAKPVFDESLMRVQEEGIPREQLEEEMDEMFDQAVNIVAESRNASISYLQRRLKVGYNRSARMIEQMEAQNMIGAQIGNRPREVYLPEVEEYPDE
jgi:S-DNA-T family DNA segregation ATPase FtsK/SpoIIIE